MSKKCVRVVDDIECGSSNEVTLNCDGFQVCKPCRIEVTNNQLSKSDLAISHAHDTTTVYVMRTPQGTIKIGRSTKLYDRLVTLGRDKFGGRMELLAAFPGTNLDEAQLHTDFAKLRITSLLGEQFRDDLDIEWFVDQVGIDPASRAEAARYARYQPRVTPKTDPDYVK